MLESTCFPEQIFSFVIQTRFPPPPPLFSLAVLVNSTEESKLSSPFWMVLGGSYPLLVDAGVFTLFGLFLLRLLSDARPSFSTFSPVLPPNPHSSVCYFYRPTYHRPTCPAYPLLLLLASAPPIVFFPLYPTRFPPFWTPLSRHPSQATLCVVELPIHPSPPLTSASARTQT